MMIKNQTQLPLHYVYGETVAQAVQFGQPLVALETAVVTHGLPHPLNLSLALDVEAEVKSQGAVPATVAMLDGAVHIGLSGPELERLATEQKTRKISLRDYGIAIARKECGGTTVAGTMQAAHTAGIRAFATGGIGGVHRGNPFDVSADLQALSRIPVLVVCAGAKAILDLPATFEYLETMGVPIIGFKTEYVPAFYSRSSGLPVNVCVDTAAEVAQIARAHWEAGLTSGLLVVVPPPEEFALPVEEVEASIQQAVEEAEAQHISGAAVTPFLLRRVSEISGGNSLKANLALLRNNARVAAQIAVEMAARGNLLSV
jgi:pseudouridylate synthase